MICSQRYRFLGVDYVHLRCPFHILACCVVSFGRSFVVFLGEHRSVDWLAWRIKAFSSNTKSRSPVRKLHRRDLCDLNNLNAADVAPPKGKAFPD